ncbi:MAG: hypothetical protein JXC85_04305 [Candidatus Aenigmarchaeota archaeon]|nr:hypothetical protein [Candidatus Aenigmarchaeota archaeon]
MRVSIGILFIFIATFFLVFIFFTMVEFNLECAEDGGDSFMPKCRIVEGRGGDFVIGVMLVGVLGMIDMGVVYKVLIDYFV